MKGKTVYLLILMTCVSLTPVAFGQRSLPASATPSANERIDDDTLSVEENSKKNKRNDKKMIEGAKVLDQASENQQPALRTR